MTGPFDTGPPVVPEKISELVSSCVRFVHTSLGLELDLTHETLPILDHYLRLTRAELEQRPEAGPLVAQATGAYFGQVLAIEFGGQWHLPRPDASDWRLYFQPFFMMLNPIGVAYELLYEGGSHPGPPTSLSFARDERPLVEARLGALPEVTHEDFFTFSTRFDVTQIAVEALRAKQQQAGLEDVTYEWGDYEDELRLT